MANDNQLQFASGNGNVIQKIVSLDSVEGLHLNGSLGQGVTSADLENATQVANAFNVKFSIMSPSANKDAVPVNNDTDANNFPVWQYQETAWRPASNPRS